MAFNFANLDAVTRRYKVEEIDYDLSRPTGLYLSNRLTEKGREIWPTLLKQAAQEHDEVWLADQIKSLQLLILTEMRKLKNKTISVDVRHDANELLAEGEFNRFYIRAVCRRAIIEKLGLEIYRAKAVANPRSDSQAKIGQSINPEDLLNDLRINTGVDTALGLPPGPGSGLSIRFGVVT